MFRFPILSLLSLSASADVLDRQRPVRPIVTPGRILRMTFTLSAVFLAVCLIAMMLGPGNVDLLSLIRRILSVPRGIGLDAPEATILLSIRLPRVLFAGVVGASLAASGAIFQSLLRNPLADPYILGISGGAAVGAIIGILVGAGAVPFGIPGLAFLGSLATIVLVFGVSGRRTDIQSNTLLLTGVIINAFFSAIILFLVSTSSDAQLHSVLFWLMGDLSFAEGSEVLLTGLFLAAGFLIMAVHARDLNLIVTGEETAMQLGVDVERTKKILFVTASMVTAVAVSVSGTIGFVGLIIPHILRLILGPDHRLLLPASILFGGTFLVAADAIARTVMAPVELPVGVVTALCGAPYFLYLLRRRAV